MINITDDLHVVFATWNIPKFLYSIQQLSIAIARAGLSIGLRGAIAQGHHKIGGTTLADCRIDILVAHIFRSDTDLNM